MEPRLACSQAPALIVNTSWNPVILAWMPKSSVQGWRTWGYDRCPCNREHETTGWHVTWFKHLHNRLVTVHGLDFGIHAEMTDFPVWLDLCITIRAGAWEPARFLSGSCFWQNPYLFQWGLAERKQSTLPRSQTRCSDKSGRGNSLSGFVIIFIISSL